MFFFLGDVLLYLWVRLSLADTHLLFIIKEEKNQEER